MTVAWLSLFLPPECIPGRVAMAMTTLLTLAAMFGAVSQNTPRVSYVSFLDVWMCSCVVFVFLTLLEYVIVLRQVSVDLICNLISEIIFQHHPQKDKIRKYSQNLWLWEKDCRGSNI